jgi:hypothetical protein
VSVTVKLWPAFIISGEFATLAPAGIVSHVTLWGAPLWLSWSTNVTVVPGATVTLAGWKFSDWSAPTFWGIVIVIEEAWACTGRTRAVVNPRATIASTAIAAAILVWLPGVFKVMLNRIGAPWSRACWVL